MKATYWWRTRRARSPSSGKAALAVLHRRADGRGSRRCRLRGDVVERRVRAGRDAARQIIDILNKTIRESRRDPGGEARATPSSGSRAKASTTPAESKARLEGDIVKWAAVIERAGIAKRGARTRLCGVPRSAHDRVERRSDGVGEDGVTCRDAPNCHDPIRDRAIAGIVAR